MPTRSLADSLSERLLDSFPADQAYTSADWDADTVPSPVRHYLNHLLRHHARQEADRLRRARTDWVDYDHPEMEQAARTFSDALETHAQVPPDQWAETLRTATHRTTAYLVRPVPTLTSFVFDESSSTVPVPQIQWRMRFFGPYAYLRNAVQAFAEKRDREALAPDSFEEVLRRVDERMTADFDADRWVDLLDPLFAVARRATGQRHVPLPALRTFFEEKNAPHIVDRLTAHELEGTSDAVTPDTLRSLIDDTLAEGRPEQREVPESPLAGDLQDSIDPAPADTTNSSSPNKTDREAAPMWKQFEQNLSRRSGKTRGQDGNDAEPLWAQFQKQRSSSSTDPDTGSSSVPGPQFSSSPSDAPPRSNDSADDLSALEREVFGAGTSPKRREYIQKLFQGDEDAYRQALEHLRTTESWSEASQIIASDVFRTHQVNIYSDAAVHFTNAVEAGFKE